LQSNSESSIGGLRAADGLEQEIYWSALVKGGQLRGDMRETAGLRGYFVRGHKAIERVKDCGGAFDRV
jgi:hypothetical protein